MPCHFSIWSKHFWNNFFHPRHPGVFIILVDLIITILYTATFILLAIFVGAFCYDHANGYLVLFISNFCIIISGLLCLQFLTRKAADLSVKRCFTLYLLLLLSFVLGITGIALLSASPTNAEMVEYTQGYFNNNFQVPVLMIKVHKLKKCCGIRGLVDYVPKNPTEKALKIPPSCCIKDDCGTYDYRNRTKGGILKHPLYYTKGCFGKKDFKDIQSPIFVGFNYALSCSYINLLLTLVLLGVYSYYVCYKLPLEDEQPKFAQGERFKQIRMLTSFQCFSGTNVKEGNGSLEGPVGNFYTSNEKEDAFGRLHGLAGSSIASFSSDSSEATDGIVGGPYKNKILTGSLVTVKGSFNASNMSNTKFSYGGTTEGNTLSPGARDPSQDSGNSFGDSELDSPNASLHDTSAGVSIKISKAADRPKNKDVERETPKN